jgi:hypothetical protein
VYVPPLVILNPFLAWSVAGFFIIQLFIIFMILKEITIKLICIIIIFYKYSAILKYCSWCYSYMDIPWKCEVTLRHGSAKL